eukprot:649808-Pleurochrysis_carterae.AAC.4
MNGGTLLRAGATMRIWVMRIGARATIYYSVRLRCIDEFTMLGCACMDACFNCAYRITQSRICYEGVRVLYTIQVHISVLSVLLWRW